MAASQQSIQQKVSKQAFPLLPPPQRRKMVFKKSSGQKIDATESSSLTGCAELGAFVSLSIDRQKGAHWVWGERGSEKEPTVELSEVFLNSIYKQRKKAKKPAAGYLQLPPRSRHQHPRV